MLIARGEPLQIHRESLMAGAARRTDGMKLAAVRREAPRKEKSEFGTELTFGSRLKVSSEPN